jgi:hypothetical protein
MERADLTELVNRADGILADIGKLRAEVAANIRASTDAIVAKSLQSAPVDSVRAYLTRGARLGGLANSPQYRTVADIQAVPARALTQVPGVDIATAQAVQAAAQAKTDHLRGGVRPRLTPERDTELVGNLLALSNADTSVKQLRRLLPRLRTRAAAAPPTAADPDAPDPAVAKVTELIDRIEEARQPASDVWAEYRRDPTGVDTLLGEFASGTTIVDAQQGFVGADVTAQAEHVSLDRSLLRTPLRGYQAFGAQYALARQRVLLCDELGLGKTLQALAVAAHLAAAEKMRHVLVICPANLAIHWVNETVKHTTLTPIEIRGSQSEERLAEWEAKGGVAIVTFATLVRITLRVRPGLVIVDEAHLLRDPKSDRARAVRNVLTSDNRIMFLTGIPMHSRIDGFRNLVDYLQPEVAGTVAPNAGMRGSIGFRRTVDRVYLRRDFRDVIDELPLRVSTEEWVRFGRSDRERYRRAVGSGNFTAIRQGAWPSGSPEPAAKLDRLIELTAEAHINGARVVVFSQFSPVLEVIRKALPSNVFGPLDDTVPDPRAVVAEFAAHHGPATLLAHVDCGALDLRKVPAPLVVILTEPQWRPQLERQIIGRTQRISELPTIRVYRLLARSSIDEPIRRLAQSRDEAPPHQDQLVRAEQSRLAK